MDKWYVLFPGIFVVLLLGGIGCALRFGRAYWLISGYSSMPEEKKKNVNIEGLGRFLGNCLLVGSGVMALCTALFALGVTWGGLAALLLLLAGVVYMFARAQRFDSNNARPGGGMATQTKVTIALLVIVLGGVVTGVLLLINASGKPVDYSVTAEALEIKCSFGETVKFADIKGLELADARPDIATRTFGSAVGEKLRGSFDLADGTAARVFVENAAPPFVHFTVGNTAYYLNCTTAEETKALFDKLEQALKQ
jgi:hypothetical protein